jgi:hypothetical protein
MDWQRLDKIMKWIKASKTQWFYNGGTYWLCVSYRARYYWVCRIEKDAGETVTATAKCFNRLVNAKEHAKELM